MPTPKTKNRAILSTEAPIKTKIETMEGTPGEGLPQPPPDGSEALPPVASAPPEDEQPPSDKITVKVVRQPINEGGVHYAKGDTLALDPARAAALGDLVEPVE
jgi:hypothetical protein